MLFAGLVFSSHATGPNLANNPNETLLVTTVKSDETQHFEQTYPLNANGRVSVSNVNGSITVDSWDRNEVKVEYTKTAESKDRLDDVEVQIDSKPEFLNIETDYGRWKRDGGGWRNGGGKLNVDIRITAPRGAVLNEIETVNGSVSIANFTNVVKSSAVNGSVSATNIRGTARLSTVNGELQVEMERLESGSKISLETVNGKVNLLIPSDSNATIKADSVNGNITNDFGLPVRKGKYVGRDLYGRLGTGDVQVHLESVNGGLSIGRKKDGKNQSPAVDLLPQKDKDGDDWDNDNDNDNDESSIEAAKLNKEVAKAVKAQQKQTEKELAKTRKQIEMIRPEITKITAESVEAAANAAVAGVQLLDSKEFGGKLGDGMRFRVSDASLFSGVPRVEKRSGSIAVKGTPKVTIGARNCSVTVRGWDKSEVQYRVTQFADPHDRTPLNINENHSDSAVNINVENSGPASGGMFPGASRVRIEIFVPKKSNLKIDANGEIRLDGVSGDVELTGADESINVRDVDGSLKVASSDGRIRVIGFRGQIDAQTSDGMINLEGDFKGLTARANDGSITVTLPDGVGADVDSNCDQVKGDGVTLTRTNNDEERSHYRIGNGGPTFKIDSEGEIRIRSANTLVARM